MDNGNPDLISVAAHSFAHVLWASPWMFYRWAGWAFNFWDRAWLASRRKRRRGGAGLELGCVRFGDCAVQFMSAVPWFDLEKGLGWSSVCFAGVLWGLSLVY